MITEGTTTPSTTTAAWEVFARSFVLAGGTLFLLLSSFVYVLDPYGTRTSAARPPTAIMDLNQRYMYPQLARSRLFDSAVFGTSTIRLLDPESLGRELGGRFANLGLNAGTPWEQLQLAGLFLRHVPSPKTLVFGLDRSWCDPAADAQERRLTFRSFPPWLYDESWFNDLPGLLSLKSLEVAGRVALHALGFMPARIRLDGYEVFTPPDASYDLVRAREHLRRGSPTDAPGAGSGDPSMTSSAQRSGFSFPALEWLAGTFASLPPTTRVLVVFPPIHRTAQADPGTHDEAVDAACKARAVEVTARHGGAAVDFRQITALTSEDANYWDKLHYRQPITDRIIGALTAATDGRAPRDDSYRVLTR